MIPAIPTLYQNVRFRSRTEARIAAFFDDLQWPWAYEPFDLEGYIPDFILKFPHEELLVEVKPDTYFDSLKSYAQKIEMSGWRKEFLVIGSTIFPGNVLGVLADDSEIENGGTHILGQGIAFECINCGSLSIRHDHQSYRCRVNGCYDGDAHVGVCEPHVLWDKWNAAGNRVQWRAA